MHRRIRGRLRLVPMAVSALAALALGEPVGAQPAGTPPTVAPDTPVTALDLRLAEAKNSPAVVVDPTNPAFAALAYRVDAQQFRCGLEVSGDGGRTWSAARPVKRLPAGAERCYAPEVAFDRTGRLHYLFVGLHTTGNTPMGVFLTSSDDNAKSFSTPRKILGADVFGVRMAIDPGLGENGRIHIAWIQTNSPPGLGSFPPPPNPVLTAYSDDLGKTFSAPVQVSDQERQRVVAPALAVGADHAVHVLYYDLGEDQRDYHNLEGPVWEGMWSLVLTTSRDAGKSYERGVLVDGEVVPPEKVMLIFTMPPASLAADIRGGVYVAWYDGRNGDWDVFLRRSADAGRSWGEPRRVNDDPPRNGRHQYLPKVAIAPNGRVDVIFNDRRNDPRNVMTDVFYTWSPDGIGPFAPNLRLTTESFDSRVGAQYRAIQRASGLTEPGGRLGLFSADDRVVAAWADTRLYARSPDDPPELAPSAADQDVWAAEVNFGPRPVLAMPADDSSDAPLVAGAIGAVVLLGALGWGLRRRSRTSEAPAH